MAPALLSQNSKVRIGVIGCGWYGIVNINAAFEAGGVECVAVCDVDSDHLNTAANDYREAPRHQAENLLRLPRDV